MAGHWKYLYWAVDRAGDTVDFLLTAKRDLAAARRFLERAINLHNVPEKSTIDKSGANTGAIATEPVDFMQREYPQYLPLMRAELAETAHSGKLADGVEGEKVLGMIPPPLA